MSELTLEKLIEKKNRNGFLEGREAILYLSLKRSEAPVSVDTAALLARLAELLPNDLQLERRKRKLAWHVNKGKKVCCQWDLIFLSELTPDECAMFADEFAALYPSKVVSIRKAGRPKKYKTPAARKAANAQYQRKHRLKVQNVAECKENPTAA